MGKLLSKFWTLPTYFKILISIAISICLLVALWLVLIAYHNWKSQKELAAELQKIRDRGEPVTLAELAPPPVPDNENAAVLYMKIGKLLEQLPYEEEELLIDKYMGKDKVNDASTMEKIRNLIKKYNNVLTLLKKANTYPKCRFPINYDNIVAMDSYYPPLFAIRQSTYLLGWHSLLYAIDNKPEKALEWWNTFSHISESVTTVRDLMGSAQASGINEIAIYTLERILDFVDFPPERYMELAEKIEPIKGRERLQNALMGERCRGIAIFDSLLSPEELTEDYREIKNLKSCWWIPRYIFTYDEVWYLKAMEENIRIAGLPYFEGEDAAHKLIVKIGKMQSAQHIITSIMLPSASGGNEGQAEVEARMGVAKIALLLKYYKAKKGKHPKSLAELADFLNKKLPVDPFAGKDYHYLPKDKDFIVYSVGWNEKDDGGVENEEEEKDDIAFSCVK